MLSFCPFFPPATCSYTVVFCVLSYQVVSAVNHPSRVVSLTAVSAQRRVKYSSGASWSPRNPRTCQSEREAFPSNTLPFLPQSNRSVTFQRFGLGCGGRRWHPKLHHVLVEMEKGHLKDIHLPHSLRRTYSLHEVVQVMGTVVLLVARGVVFVKMKYSSTHVFAVGGLTGKR